jgi:hypothetical protein
VARSSFSLLVNRNSTPKRVLKMNPNAAGSAVLTAAATAALVTVLLVKCTQLFVQNVELTLRFHSVLLMAGQFTARNVSKDNGPLSKVIRSTYTGLVSPVFYFLRGCKRGGCSPRLHLIVILRQERPKDLSL